LAVQVGLPKHRYGGQRGVGAMDAHSLRRLCEPAVLARSWVVDLMDQLAGLEFRVNCLVWTVGRAQDGLVRDEMWSVGWRLELGQEGKTVGLEQCLGVALTSVSGGKGWVDC